MRKRTAVQIVSVLAMLPCEAFVLAGVPVGSKASGSIVEPVLQTGFETSPLDAGWQYGQQRWRRFFPLPEEAQSVWANAEGTRHVEVRPHRQWISPKVVCTPLGYYRIDLRTRGDMKGYWLIRFYDARGRELSSNIYSSVLPAKEWACMTGVFRAREKAVSFRIALVGRESGVQQVSEVKVTPVDRQAVCRWADGLYKTLPPLKYVPAPARWKHLPKTMAKLRQGKALCVVMLGDSIINDTNNSNFETLLMRLYPKADVKILVSVEGGKGCWYYNKRGRVKPYVIDRKPDLLMIGGISQGVANLADIEAVAKQAREATGCEVLLMTGPMGDDKHRFVDESRAELLDSPTWVESEYAKGLRELAAKNSMGFLDMQAIWQRYLNGSRKPHEWFHRDLLHANDRGKQVLGRILEAYFAPRTEGQVDPAKATGGGFMANLSVGKKQTVVAYGTSLTANGAWVSQLRDALSKRFPGQVTVVNSGGSGKWSNWGVQNLDAKVLAKKPDAVFIEFSINDSVARFKCTPEKARVNLETMIARILKANPRCQIILMTMTPGNGHPVGHFSHRKDISSHYAMVRDVARDRGLLLIDHDPHWRRLQKSNPARFKKLVPDTIHPTAEGCATLVTPVILRTLGN